MMGSVRRGRAGTNIWPGYVDALSALLMLVIFMLLVYVVSQLYLSQTLSDRDTQLARLRAQLTELSQLLGLEQDRSAALERQMATLQDDYSASLATNDALATELDNAREQLKQQTATLDGQSEQLARLETSLADKAELSDRQQAMILRLSNQIASLQAQLETIASALELQESLTAEKQAELDKVSQRLNLLLAERVNRLQQYQSEFFARLRDILADNDNIRVVGDRFLLPSELLFASGSAELGPDGRAELDKLATVLLDVAARIPADVDWILRVDGHTDIVPINTPRFPSNWELSTARAVAVVRYLADRGIPQRRMAAAGFGEFFPVAEGSSPEALQKNRRIEFKLTDR